MKDSSKAKLLDVYGSKHLYSQSQLRMRDEVLERYRQEGFDPQGLYEFVRNSVVGEPSNPHDAKFVSFPGLPD